MKTLLRFEVPVLILTCLVFAFWAVVFSGINLYKYPVTGGVFEFLWLFMVGFVFLLPALSLLQFFGRKGNIKSVSSISVILNFVLIGGLIILNL